MTRRWSTGIHQEVAIILGLASVAAILSLAAYFVAFRQESGREHLRNQAQTALSDSSVAASAQEPLLASWLQLDHRQEVAGVALSVHSFRVQPERMTFVYSMDAESEDSEIEATQISILDDLGYSYQVISHRILGSDLGVTVGIVTVEPYRGEGTDLTLVATQISDASSDETSSLPDRIGVTFLRNASPGSNIDYDAGGRIGPEVATHAARGLTTGLASLPGGKYIRLLVDRSGQQAEILGYAPNGLGGPVSRDEFAALIDSDPNAFLDLNSTLPDWPESASQ